MTGRALLCALAILISACAQTVPGTAVRTIPALDENSRSPIDVDAVLLDRTQMQAVTGSGADLTAVPGMESKVPVDIPTNSDLLPGVTAETVPPQCVWLFAETAIFGPEIEEFHKTTYQSPARGGLISQAAAGYRDAATARRTFDALSGRVEECGRTGQGPSMVGEVTVTADSLRTRPGACGRDYGVKSSVLVEVTFCSFPDSVPDIVMTNILHNVPG